MRKLLTFGFGFAFAVSMLTGFGCALTNYELITDNDQGQSGPKGKGHGHNNGGGVVDTAGNSYVRQSSQAATTYPDGTDNLIWFVDQKKNGDRKLSTVNYFTTQGSAFKDDLYCSPDWGGCKVSTSNDPEIGDVDDYDYRANLSDWAEFTVDSSGTERLRLEVTRPEMAHLLLADSNRYDAFVRRFSNGDPFEPLVGYLENSRVQMHLDADIYFTSYRILGS